VTLRRLLIVVAFAAVASAGAPAWAHADAGHAGGFVTGLRHPASGLDHVAAMVAVGIWGAQMGRPAVWLLPVAFPMMMAVGAAMAILGLHLPGVEIGVALSGVALGAMVLFEARPPLSAAAAIVGVFAVFHGHAHGTELPAGASGLLYSIGFVVGTGLLHGVGIALGLLHRWRAGRVALRAAGAAIAVGGAVFLVHAAE
jgi:urease accessory protein